ncbi:hypothetical protein [Enterococcus sp. AZ126]|uniref:hypothetical protein n=1 Tax=Enterococcus sp. AZ126 TaxID=2774635 RepID=UPI003F216FFC
MNNIRYAFASVSYHKKFSFAVGISSAFFLFLLTSILNLRDIENSFYNQVNTIINNNEYHMNYQKIMQLYSSLYIVTFFIWIVLISTLIYLSLKMKKQDMMKWRIMGFSNRYVIQQSILESIIPLLIGVLITAVFLLICQHTYEYILIQMRPLLTNAMGIKRVAFFSPNVFVENTPNQLISTPSDTHFLTTSINNLPFDTILKAFIKNCLLLVTITTSITIFSTYFLSKKSKKEFRM